MIASLMLYAALVGLCLCGAAWSLEFGAALAGLPRRRWIWSVALCALAALTVLVPSRTLSDSGVTIDVTTSISRSVTPAQIESDKDALLLDVSRAVRGGLDQTLAVSTNLDPLLAVCWAISSAAIGLIYVAGLTALSRRRRGWRLLVVESETVLVAPDLGPAVVGLFPSRIVLPEWVFTLNREARLLILQHEREHMNAADPWMLHAAVLLVMTMPWNPAVWWMASRLRLAIEIDCDARVVERLRLETGGDARQRYGDLLLDIASRRLRSSSLFVVPALMESSSTLARRIVAMFPKPLRLVAARTIMAAAFAALLTGAAVLIPSARLLALAPLVSSPAGIAPKPDRLAAEGRLSAAAVTIERIASRSMRAASPAATTRIVQTPTTPAPTPAQTASAAVPVPEFGAGALAPDTPNIVVAEPTRRVSPMYTPEMMRNRITGHIEVEIVVGTDGSVEAARIRESLDRVYGLDQAALDAARQWTFTPASLDGVPVRAICVLGFDFRIS
ncbi:MAG: M56 family metallopeptidase [Vicinamibacterales bacterium]